MSDRQENRSSGAEVTVIQTSEHPLCGRSVFQKIDKPQNLKIHDKEYFFH